MPAWVLHNAVLALPLAGAVWLVVRRLKPRPAVAHALWLLVVLRLALPPVVAWPWALPLPWAKQAAPVEAVAEPEVVSDSVSDVAYELVVVSGELLEEIPPPPPVEEVAPPPPFPWCWWLGVAWLTGTAVVAGVSVRQTWRLSREVRAAALAPPELLERVRRASRKLGVTPPLVRVTPALVSPVIIGFARPVLLWPVGLERKLTADGAAAVLAHELAHLKRRDHWVRWLELLAFVLHWWNPLFRPVRRRLREEAELACDAVAVAAVPGGRRAFAEALLAVARRPLSPAPAAVLGVDRDATDFQRRLTMIMQSRDAGRLSLRTLALLGLLAVLALPAWTLGGDEPKRTVVLSDVSVDGNVELIVLDQPKPDADSKKIEEIEKKLAELHKSLAELRGGKATNSRAVTRVVEGQPLTLAKPAEVRRGVEMRAVQRPVQVEGHPLKAEDVRYRVELDRPGAQPINLSRTTYQLPAGKAEALAALLKDAKTTTVETKIDGDKLTVTTTPEMQSVIGQFVGVIKGGSAARLFHFVPAGGGEMPLGTRAAPGPDGKTIYYYESRIDPAGAEKPLTFEGHRIQIVPAEKAEPAKVVPGKRIEFKLHSTDPNTVKPIQVELRNVIDETWKEVEAKLHGVEGVKARDLAEALRSNGPAKASGTGASAGTLTITETVNKGGSALATAGSTSASGGTLTITGAGGKGSSGGGGVTFTPDLKSANKATAKPGDKTIEIVIETKDGKTTRRTTTREGGTVTVNEEVIDGEKKPKK